MKCLSLSSTYLTVELERLTRKQSRQMINGSCSINLVYFSVSGGHMPCRMSLFSLGQKASVAVLFCQSAGKQLGKRRQIGAGSSLMQTAFQCEGSLLTLCCLLRSQCMTLRGRQASPVTLPFITVSHSIFNSRF